MFLLQKEKIAIKPTEIYSKIDLTNIPQHVAVVMDGNRRWAKDKGLPLMMGHWEGAETLTRIVKAAVEIGIKVLTVFAFSTENWARAKAEIEWLMQIFEKFLLFQKNILLAKDVRLQAIGNIAQCTPAVQRVLREVTELTKSCQTLDLVLAINYGARDEIARAIKKIALDLENKKINKEQISENFIANYLDTAQFKDPDLLIRTSGEKRLSNFLLWQISYTEIYTTEVLWPDFQKENLYEAILDYQKRERRKGGS